jgi:hypothetical protein
VSPLATWFAGAAALRNFRCGVGSGGARRLSLADYVMETGATRGATAAGGC